MGQMQHTRAAIIGYGNVGRAAADALAASPDFELAGVVRRKAAPGDLLRGHSWVAPSVSSITDLEGVQAALVCVPTRELAKVEFALLESGISVVDAFDIHGEAICAHKEALQPSAISGQAVGVIASGWDPGIDSVIRALMEVAAPAGSTYTNFEPGMSMGHSVIARSVPGVEDAISITLPAGRGRHKRAVYVVPDGSRPFQDVAGDIASDPCFVDNETEVFPVTSVEPFADNGHAVRIEREGVIGAASGQVFEWHMKICNPAATAQIMLGALRAALRAEPGVYTLLELPIAHMLPGSIGENIRRLI
jgi:diaminopimelate dehydrogenase